MTDAVLVDARDVARTFGSGPTAVVALHDVSCVVRAGDQIALTGPSGSGKTTLLHILAGLDTPTIGTVVWPAIGDRKHLRPGPIAVVFQAPSLIPALDVAENVALPMLLQGIDRRTADRRALIALEWLDLNELAAKLPEELSGGQAQRVAVARVLAGQPQLILADEPTGQLDHDNAARLIDALIAVAGELDAALVVNTHDPVVSQHFAHHWRLHDGQLDVEPATERARC